MKKATITLGFIAAFLITVATIFKVMHWPGGGMFTVLGITFFMALFQPLAAVYNGMQSTPSRVKVFQILAILFGITLADGIMFKLMHWPGSGFMIIMGLFLTFLVTLPYYIILVWKKEPAVQQLGPITVLSFYGYACFFISFLSLMPTGLQLQALNNILEHETVTSGVLYENRTMNTQMTNALVAPGVSIEKNKYDLMKASEKLADDAINFMQEIKIDLIMQGAGLSKEEAMQKKIQELMIGDNYDLPTYYLVGDNPNNPEGKAKELKTYIRNYRELLVKYIGTDLPVELLNTEDAYLGLEENVVPWETRMFYNHTLTATFTNLTALQNQILALQQMCLNSAIGNALPKLLQPADSLKTH